MADRAVLRSATLAAVLALAVGLLTAFAPAAEVLAWSATLALGLLASQTLRGRTTVGLVMVYGYLAFGVLAALFFAPTAQDYAGNNAVLAAVAEVTPNWRYLIIFTVCAAAAWAGALLVGVLFAPADDRRVTFPTLALPTAALALAAVPFLLDLIGTGPHTVISATTYLEITGPKAFEHVGRALGPIGVLTSGYFAFDATRRTEERLAGAALALGYELLYFGVDTRNFALWVPLMLVGGVLGGSWTTRRRRVAVGVTVALTILFLQIPLALRTLPQHGLVASFRYTLTQPSLVFGGANPLHNTLLGAPLTVYVGRDLAPLPLSDLTTSISPLPSFLNDWNAVEPSLRVNAVVPYGTLGQLLNRGWGLLIAFIACSTAILVAAERFCFSGPVSTRGLRYMVVLGVATLFVVQSSEYQLRSTARLVYYVVAVVAALSFSPRSTFARRAPRRPYDVRARPSAGGEL